MGAANFIKKRFIGKQLCFTFGDDVETITYDQTWSSNVEYFKGTVIEVDENIIVLEIEKEGKLYINEDNVKCFWEPSFNYYKATSASITNKPAGRKRK